MFSVILEHKLYLLELAWLFIMGAFLTVGSIERTLKAGEGNWALSAFYTLIVSLATWYSLRAAAEEDCISFAVFSAGTIFASAITALLHRKKSKKRIDG